MITIRMCICMDYATKYTIIIPIVGQSMTCEHYFVDTFALRTLPPFDFGMVVVHEIVLS